ncbi:ArsC family reductase [Stakelama sp. CBK3Z-3]|uniref:ArsC family reductase n=1 Tax=Stakelama flava TaxID=2860338 RepID=A0ABS6XMM8_9SPHN|nr:ArsC family reductase [Stakelama flava]MBW4331416.1 ArsC family reductase [Stakelama flava]
MSVTIHGIKNCDTMKKARAWLDEHGIGYRFHDYRADGIDAATLELWADRVGWEKLLNKAGTTFRKLPDAQKQDIDRARAIALMVENPAMIKRPVLEYPGGILVGFKPGEYGETLL